MLTGYARAIVIVVASVIVCSAADAAFADGGQSIASAPMIAFGQQEFGNTANGAKTGFDGDDDGSNACSTLDGMDSFWTAHVVSGDKLIFDWKAQNRTVLNVLPVGTTDFTANSTTPDAIKQTSSNQKTELSLVESRTGTAPVIFCANSPSDLGPYDFTAYVLHALRLSLGAIHRLSHHRTSVRVGVHDPDGAPITDRALALDLQVKSQSTWRTMSTVRPGSARFVFTTKWGRSHWGKRVRLRVRAHGSGYLSATSPSAVVQVP
jgi:hypothetical protein